jgi:pyruvate dehydrogenase E1 component beta subunit
MVDLNMVQAINLALRQEMEKDPRVLVMGQDVGVDGGVFRVTEGLRDKFGKERVIDTPLAESAIVGSAIGMAIGGLRPVAEIQFDGFSYLMLQQIECNASRYRTRSRGMFTVPMVVRMPYGGGVRALEHHSESKEVFWGHIPGLKTVIPSSPRTARALLTAAIRDPDPVVFMEPKRLYRAFKEDVPEAEDILEIGKARIVREGDDITVVSWGAMFHETSKVVDDLIEQTGASVELIDLMTIAPMDAQTIADSVNKTGRCVVVQEAQKTFGAASEIIALINERAFFSLKAPVTRVTMYDVPMPLLGREEMYMPTPGRIRRAIEETLNY